MPLVVDAIDLAQIWLALDGQMAKLPIPRIVLPDTEGPILSLEIDDSGREDLEATPFVHGQSRSRRRQTGPKSRLATGRYLARTLIWFLKVAGGFISGFLFASYGCLR